MWPKGNARRPIVRADRLEGDLPDAVRKLKAESGPELQVHGSTISSTSSGSRSSLSRSDVKAGSFVAAT